MQVLEAGERLGVLRGEVVVAIPVFGALEQFEKCLVSVVTRTPADAWLLISDDAGPEGAEAIVRRVAGGRDRVAYRRRAANGGFVRNCNDIFEVACPADVVLLNSDVEVPPGWLQRLSSAALSDTTVATATPLTNHGTILSVPDRNHPRPGLPEGWTLEEADRAIAAASPRLRPRIPTAIGHCFYIRRPALELVGGFAEAFAPAYGEEVDFSQRCLARGLVHVAADDLLVLHHGSASYGPKNPIQQTHEEQLGRRYPYYHAWIQEVAADSSSPLARSLAAARHALQPLTVTIDGSCLGDVMTGTQVQTLEVIQALADTRRVSLRVAVPRRLGAHARAVLGRLHQIHTIVWELVGEETPKSDVVHRPYQVGRSYELQKLFWLGERVVVTHQDFIAYRNPSYFDSYDWWFQYRRMARLSLAVADRVVFISEHTRDEALLEEMLPAQRAVVVYNGVDHRHEEAAPPPRPPVLAAAIAEHPFLLCLGVDFRHKNRLFALELFRELRSRQGWEGRLVLAGPRASPGSSFKEEAAWLTAHPGVAPFVFDLHNVSEPVKQWLLEHARLMVSPSTYEGFGLIPFEAAAAGLPTLFAAQTSMRETMPPEAALIEPWDAESAAKAALTLLQDESARARQLELVKGAAERFSWHRTAEELLAVYGEAADGPVPPARAFESAGFLPRTQKVELRVLDPRKVLRFWREYGFAEGTRRGIGGVARRIRRRIRGR